MAKAADGTYRPGRRDWVKVKSWETTEVIIVAVTGSLERPETIVVGLMADGVLTYWKSTHRGDTWSQVAVAGH